MSKYPVIIGRFEHIDIIDMLNDIPVKIDTGAFRSSIHASDIRIVEKSGKQMLHCKLAGHPVFSKKRAFKTKSFGRRVVRSSNGQTSERYEITLKIRLGYKVFSTPFTLADRSENIFPILIGRKSLASRYLVDVSKTGINKPELKQAATMVDDDQQTIEGVNV